MNELTQWWFSHYCITRKNIIYRKFCFAHVIYTYRKSSCFRKKTLSLLKALFFITFSHFKRFVLPEGLEKGCIGNEWVKLLSYKFVKEEIAVNQLLIHFHKISRLLR